MKVVSSSDSLTDLLRFSKTMEKLFEPIVIDIDRLISDQIRAVKLKRLEDRKPGAAQIKVCVAYVLL